MDITLPTSAVLNVTPAPFEDAKALWQALLEDLRGINMDSEKELDINLFKDIFCTGFSSKKIEAALWKCFARCRYKDDRGDLKIDKDTFEPETAREDYLNVCFEVTRVNCAPFFKTLVSNYGKALSVVKSVLTQGSTTK